MSNIPKHERAKNNYELEFIDPSEIIEFQEEPGVLEPAKAAEYEDDETEEALEMEEGSYLARVKESTSDYVIKSREDTRGKLALTYTVFTFFIFFISIVIAVIDGLNRNVSIIDNLREILPLLSGIFLGTLGFILGYYFKKSEDRD